MAERRIDKKTGFIEYTPTPSEKELVELRRKVKNMEKLIEKMSETLEENEKNKVKKG